VTKIRITAFGDSTTKLTLPQEVTWTGCSGHE